MGNLLIKIEALLASAFHTTADRLAFGVDKATYLDLVDIEKPSIPATSIKGVIRHQVESTLKGFGKNICFSPNPSNMCNSCIICKIFGSPKNPAKLVFYDAQLMNSTVDSRIGVSINRRRRTAQEEQLFSAEIAFGKRWKTEIKGILPSEDEALVATTLVFIGAKTAFAIGGSNSRGLGWIQLKDFRAYYDQKEFAVKDIKQKLRELLKNG